MKILNKHICKLECDCGWNVTIGGTDKKELEALQKFIKESNCKRCWRYYPSKGNIQWTGNNIREFEHLNSIRVIEHNLAKQTLKVETIKGIIKVYKNDWITI